MGTVEDRVAAVERHVAEHDVMLDGLREAVASLDRRIGSLETRMDERFTTLQAHLDQRFTAIDQRFTTVDQRFVGVDERFVTIDQRFVAMDVRFTALDAKMSRQFLWILGVQMTMFATVMATLLSAFALQR